MLQSWSAVMPNPPWVTLWNGPVNHPFLKPVSWKCTQTDFLKANRLEATDWALLRWSQHSLRMGYLGGKIMYSRGGRYKTWTLNPGLDHGLWTGLWAWFWTASWSTILTTKIWQFVGRYWYNSRYTATCHLIINPWKCKFIIASRRRHPHLPPTGWFLGSDVLEQVDSYHFSDIEVILAGRPCQPNMQHLQ